jgi:hypothetical protein
MGIKQVSSWGASYAAVDEAIPFLDESFSANYARIQSESLLGFGGREPSDQGNLSVPGTTNHELDYDNFITLYEAVMGTNAGGVVTIDTVLDQFTWIEFEKAVSVWRAESAVALKMVIAGEHGGIVKGSWDWIAKDLQQSTSFPSITPTSSGKILFEELRCRIGDLAGALSSGDDMAISAFELEFDRNMKIDDYTTQTAEPNHAIQPIEGGFRACSLKITLPRYNANTWETFKNADADLQCELYFNGSAGGLKIEIPHMKITEGFDQPIGGPGPVTIEGGFECFRSNSANPMLADSPELKITVT